LIENIFLNIFWRIKEYFRNIFTQSPHRSLSYRFDTNFTSVNIEFRQNIKFRCYSIYYEELSKYFIIIPPPPPFLLLIRNQFYFRKHQISIKKYVIRRKKKYFRNILKQFSSYLSPIRHQFYFRKHGISIENEKSMLFNILNITFEIFWYNPPAHLSHRFYVNLTFENIEFR